MLFNYSTIEYSDTITNTESININISINEVICIHIVPSQNIMNINITSENVEGYWALTKTNDIQLNKIGTSKNNIIGNFYIIQSKPDSKISINQNEDYYLYIYRNNPNEGSYDATVSIKFDIEENEEEEEDSPSYSTGDSDTPTSGNDSSSSSSSSDTATSSSSSSITTAYLKFYNNTSATGSPTNTSTYTDPTGGGKAKLQSHLNSYYSSSYNYTITNDISGEYTYIVTLTLTQEAYNLINNNNAVVIGYNDNDQEYGSGPHTLTVNFVFDFYDGFYISIISLINSLFGISLPDNRIYPSISGSTSDNKAFNVQLGDKVTKGLIALIKNSSIYRQGYHFQGWSQSSDWNALNGRIVGLDITQGLQAYTRNVLGLNNGSGYGLHARIYGTDSILKLIGKILDIEPWSYADYYNYTRSIGMKALDTAIEILAKIRNLIQKFDPLGLINNSFISTILDIAAEAENLRIEEDNENGSFLVSIAEDVQGLLNSNWLIRKIFNYLNIDTDVFSIYHSLKLYPVWTKCYNIVYHSNPPNNNENIYDEEIGWQEYDETDTTIVLSQDIDIPEMIIGGNRYAFTGWIEKDNASTVYSAGSSFQASSGFMKRLGFKSGEDIHLYAQWELRNYIIKYFSNINDDSPIKTIDTYSEGSPARIISYESVKNSLINSGYIFKGWTKNPLSTIPMYHSGEDTATNEKPITTSTSLYAVWWPEFNWDLDEETPKTENFEGGEGHLFDKFATFYDYHIDYVELGKERISRKKRLYENLFNEDKFILKEGETAPKNISFISIISNLTEEEIDELFRNDNGELDEDRFQEYLNNIENPLSNNQLELLKSPTYQFFPNGTSKIEIPIEPPKANHKYYGRCYEILGENSYFNSDNGDARFEYFSFNREQALSGQSDVKDMIFSQATVNNLNPDNSIRCVSNICSLSEEDLKDTNGNYYDDWCLRSFTVGLEGTFYRSEMMIIDLTEAFGSGKEPNKEWCDEYIPYIKNSYLYIENTGAKLYKKEEINNILSKWKYNTRNIQINEIDDSNIKIQKSSLENLINLWNGLEVVPKEQEI